MNMQVSVDFERIKKAIEYINSHYKSQPNLNEIADHVNLSTHHFQRMFTEWAGVSPKHFLQYISIVHARELLKDTHTTLFDATCELGLSSTSRLHDLFIHIEGMTPAEYKNGGKNLLITYNFYESPFGEVLVASTTKGICHMSFVDSKEDAMAFLKEMYPNSTYHLAANELHQKAIDIFQKDWSKLNEIKLHIKGTPFQIKVWETLLTIPFGKLTTYGNIAQQLNNSKASRAVGSAIGNNPVAFLIPCHRVIQSTGIFGQYHWGSTRKTAIIGWEGAKRNLVK
jgi:AraC family transcriptional regulator of adaptative response/methylated-DNA-[protein]-cysteine methyltransferase